MKLHLLALSCLFFLNLSMAFGQTSRVNLNDARLNNSNDDWDFVGNLRSDQTQIWISSSGGSQFTIVSASGIPFNLVSIDARPSLQQQFRYEVYPTNNYNARVVGSAQYNNFTETTQAAFSNITSFTINVIEGPANFLNFLAFEMSAIPGSPATVVTGATSNITFASARVSGNVTAHNGAFVTDKGIVYSAIDTSPTIGSVNTIRRSTNTTGIGSYALDLNSLAPGTRYYVRAYATNSAGTSYGNVVNFNTVTRPLATTSGGTINSNWNSNTVVDNTITVAHTANLTGASVWISSGFQGSADRLWFVNQNGISGSYNTGTGVLSLSGNASVANYQAALRTIQFSNSNTPANGGNRVVSFNVSEGSNTGATVTRTVNLVLQLPTVTTAVSSVLLYSAEMLGNATSTGGALITSRGLVYSTSNSTPTIGGANVTNINNGSGLGNFSTELSGLSPGTTYRVRSYATNSVGTGYGNIEEITTLRPSISLNYSNPSYSAMTSTYGEASASRLVNLYASNLSGPVSITAPSGFEVSTTQGSGYQDNISVGSSGAINGMPIYIRLKGNNFAGDYSGIMSFASADAITENLSVPSSTVARRAVTVTPNSGQGKIYGNAEPNYTYSIGGSGLVFSDTFTGSVSRVAGENVGSYAISQGSLLLSSNYVLTFTNNVIFSVTARPITITPNTGQSKTYGNNDPSALSYTIGGLGLVNSDTFSGNLGRLNGENVGNYAITLGSLSAGGNYSVNLAGGVGFSITQRAITVTPNASQTKIYGNVDPAYTFTIGGAGLAFSDTFAGSLSRVAGEVIGTYAFSLGSLTAGTNYALTFTGGLNFSIGQRSITVVPNTGQSKTYGNVDPAFTYTVGGSGLAFADTFIGDLSRTPGEHVASYQITQGSLALNSNYNVTFVNGVGFAIGQRPVTVIPNSGQSKIYGNMDPVYTYTVSDAGLAFSDSFSGTLSRSPGENVADYSINQGSLNLSGNYTLTFTNNVKFAIDKRSISVTANANQSKTYGESDPILSYTIGGLGLVNGDTFSGSLSRTFGDQVGNYPIIVGSLVINSNYDINFISGSTFAIRPRLLSLSFEGVAKVYDGNRSATVVINDDRLVGDDVMVNYTAADFDDKNVGSGKTVTVNGISINGTDGINYAVSATASTAASITIRNLLISAVPTDKVYDGQILASVNLQDNRIVGDNLTTSFSTATFNNKTVASGKIVTVNGIAISGTDARNYIANLTATTAASITHRSLVVSATATDKIYDGNPSAMVGLTDNRVSGDVVSLAYANAVFNDKNVAQAKTVTVSGIQIGDLDAVNYEVNPLAVTAASITSRSLVIGANAIDKVYDGNASAVVDLVDDRVAGDAITASYNSADFDDKTVAFGKTVTVNGITIGGTDAHNYMFNTIAATTASVTIRNLLISAGATEKVYDGNDLATVNLTDNRVVGDVFALDFTAAKFSDKRVAVGKTVTVAGLTLSGVDASNYVFNATAFTRANITSRNLLISAAASDKVYDGSTVAGVNFGDNRVAFDELNIGYGTANFDDANVAAAKTVTVNSITLTGSDATNYTFNAAAATAASITAKVLTITADAQSRLQGAINPTLTVSYSGFIPGQTHNNALVIQPIVVTDARVGSFPGSYPITASGAAAAHGNYTIRYIGGTMTVNAAAVNHISLAANVLYENSPIGTLVGTLSSISTDPVATFTYSLVSGSGSADNFRFTVLGNQIQTAAPLDFEAQANYSIRVKAVTQFGVSSEETFRITILDVNESPTLNAVAHQTVCYTIGTQNIGLTGLTSGPEIGQTLSMTITTNNPGLFRSLAVVKDAGDSGTFSYGISNGWSGTAVVTITLKDDGGTAHGGADTFTRTFSITVNPLPVVNIASSVPSLSVSKGDVLELTAQSPGAVRYSWSTANGILSGQNSSVLRIRPTQTTTYTVTAFNDTGCSEREQITIEVKSDFFAVKANNILTPNGDGMNDTWVIANIDQYPDAEVKVFDSGRRLVFSKKGYDNSWTGTYKGMDLAQGAYMYVIDFGKGFFAARGSITIIRNP